MSHDAWATLGLFITNSAGLLALWIRSGRTKARAEDAASSAAVAAHEVRPNSGKSLADAVNRIEAAQQANTRATARNTREVAILRGQFKEHVLSQRHRWRPW